MDSRLTFACACAAAAFSMSSIAAPLYSQTIDAGPLISQEFHRPFSISFVFTGVPVGVGGAVLSITATGDIGGIGEYLRVDDVNARPLGFVFGDNVSGAEPITLTDTLEIEQSMLAASVVSGVLALYFVSERSFASAYATFNSLTLTVPEPVSAPPVAALLGIGILCALSVRRISWARPSSG